MVTLHNIFEKMLFIVKPVLLLKGFRKSKSGNVYGVYLLLPHPGIYPVLMAGKGNYDRPVKKQMALKGR